jgi:hypothetical protein
MQKEVILIDNYIDDTVIIIFSKYSKVNYALLNQARVISAKRLNNKFGKISVDDYKSLKDKFLKLYG